MYERQHNWEVPARIVVALLAVVLAVAWTGPAESKPLVTYITGDTPADGQVIFRALFDSAVKDSAILSIVAKETDPDLRLDNIDFVPGLGFSEVIVTAQTVGAISPPGGALTSYNVKTGAELPDVIAATNAVGPPFPGASKPCSIVPNAAGTHYYYTENQFGFASATHRMIRVPITGPAGAAAVAYDAGADGLVELSGIEIIDDRLYFFAHDTLGPPAERQLYSVPLGVGGLASGPPVLEVFGLDRSGVGGPGPGLSDGSDEMDFDPSTGLLYGTNIGTGEVIGFKPGAGPIGVGALPFYIDPALITASAAFGPDGTFDGLGLLSGIVTPGAVGPVRQIDGIRPDGAGHLVVIGHEGVLVSIDTEGVLADGADDGDIIRLFNRDVGTAGATVGFSRAGLMFDDHTILAPVPEPGAIVVWTLLGTFVLGLMRRRRSG
jgi:hypothetical protein